MKKYIKIIVGIIFLLTIISACKDSFLDEEVLDAYAPSTLTNKLGYEAAAVGLYNQFSYWLTYTDNQEAQCMYQLGTDITWNANSTVSNGNTRAFHDYTILTSSNELIKTSWGYLYKLINNANVMIKNAGSALPADMTQADVNLYKGEALFFRAYAYNQLATLWGGVPLLTDPLTQPKTDLVRASVEDVNAVIIKDLLFAINSLPDINTAKEARANKSMARQLLAEVYLRTNQAPLAEKQCDSIISTGYVSLVKNRYGSTAAGGDAFSDMFRVGKTRRGQGNTEAIWILQQENPVDVPGGSTGNPQQRRNWGGAYHNIVAMAICDSLGGRGLGRLRLDNWVLYGLYGAGDMRNSQYSIHRQHYFNSTNATYAPIKGQPVPYGQNYSFTPAGASKPAFTIAAGDTAKNLAPYTLKYGQFDPRDEFGYGMWKDFILMRLGETYLLRAEAKFKQSNLQGAADDINALRTRAKAAQVTSADITLNFILDERVRELLGEENRRMTLVRTGTLVERAKRLCGTTKVSGLYESTNGLQDFHMLLPIPQSEIDLNKDAVLTQNPGY